MFYLVFGFILLSSGHDFLVCSQCVPGCADKPHFSTSILAVELGGPANASCRLCRHDCLNSTIFGLEVPEGKFVKNGTELAWTVDRFTQWKANLMCHYTLSHRKQCCANLPVVSYRPPQNISLSLESGPVMEGQRVTLHCSVSGVAFVGSLNLTIYRENALVHQMTRKSQTRDRRDWTSEHIFNASKEDQATRFWCEADLGLEVGAGQHSVVFQSNTITAEVYYKPRLKGPQQSVTITLRAGDRLQLNCSAEGNPAPNYTWTHQASPHPLSHDGVLSVEAVTSGSEGHYDCSARNAAGATTFRVTVVVQKDYTYVIIGVVLGAVALAAAIFAVIYTRYYSLNRTGQYNLIDVFHFTCSKTRD
ncbi:vascular cell adhesion protein 1-like [Synchiropus splendidus]|uniref:vascular cell adhesion protein 1-like n=1 Tax=Synchiropus splendidus TaxID=270530 RepID=UPI00237E28D4|nr:vascular cell adhesion protein 1-like [Synchiropus splendidus]